MKAKVTKVALERECDKVTQEFEISHAERILKMKQSGWRLPKTSKYKFDLNNGITIKRNKGKDTAREQASND